MFFEFNLYSSLLMPAFVQGLLFAVLLWWRGIKEERRSDTILAWLLLIFTATIANWMLGFAGWYDSHDGYSTFMFYFPFGNGLALGPLLYFYFLALSNHRFAFNRKTLIHFIPALLLLTIQVVVFVHDVLIEHLLQGKPYMDHYGTKGSWAAWTDRLGLVFSVASYLSFLVYLFLSIRAYSRYSRYVQENFSATEDIRFTWIRNLLYAIAAGVILMLIFEGVVFLGHIKRYYIWLWYSYFFRGLIIYYVSIAGYFTASRMLHKLDFHPEKLPLADMPPPTGESLVVTPATVIPDWEPAKQKLLACMETEKPWLDAELTLAELAKILQTNPSLLSKLINEGTGQNFNDFINGYRVQAVMGKLKAGEQKTQTLLGIAYDCGFNSKATFNRAFKKLTNLSPKAFIESL
jgi:AraC-like DNA-binding protein